MLLDSGVGYWIVYRHGDANEPECSDYGCPSICHDNEHNIHQSRNDCNVFLCRSCICGCQWHWNGLHFIRVSNDHILQPVRRAAGCSGCSGDCGGERWSGTPRTARCPRSPGRCDGRWSWIRKYPELPDHDNRQPWQNQCEFRADVGWGNAERCCEWEHRGGHRHRDWK